MSLMDETKSLLTNRKFIVGLVSFIFITLALGGVFSYQAASTTDAKTYEEVRKVLEQMSLASAVREMVPANTSFTLTGTVGENSHDVNTINIEQEYITNITFVLTWRDEPAQDVRHENQPDYISLEVKGPEGSGIEESAGPQSNPIGGEGRLVLNFTCNLGEGDIYKGKWTVTVVAGECGDQEPILLPLPLGLRTIPDDGNAYSVRVYVEYYTPTSS